MKRFYVALTLSLIPLIFIAFLYTRKEKVKIPEGYSLVIELVQEGFQVKLYTKGGSLRVGRNHFYLEVSPLAEVRNLYLYMPPMPGMGEMREDAHIKRVGNLYEGHVNISMAGSWQLVLKVNEEVLKKEIIIPTHGVEGQKSPEAGIRVDTQRLQLVGIQVQEVKREELMESFQGVGYVSYDLSRAYEVSVRSDGWVLDTFGRFEGELIGKGTPLMKLLSPDIKIAEAELKLVREMGRNELEKAVLGKLSYLQAGEVVSSPLGGVIIEKKVFPGGFLRAGETAYRIVDISRVWVVGEVPIEKAGSLSRGMRVLISPLGGSESIVGRVSYVFPEANREARSLKVRIEIQNPRGKLLVNQPVDLHFERPLGSVLAVPESAVVDTGRRTVVFVELEPGLYA
ncbi:MAG: efflux RND transporter periplasmic adaptor subunit, partial [Aquificaceae bacterium]|nr:efflux RND transporter periplasmic adaptor subunit [Aquificaceae bacterium]